MAVITLLTDFGLEDAYVGIVKGAILSVNPAATIVDITHSIPPGDVMQAAYYLETSCGYFPHDAVHVVVVDPGVGSGRGIVALKTNGQRFLAPDNGVLSALLSKGTGEQAVMVENTRYFLAPLSRTFHGRDIFAPVAAHLSKGMDMSVLGPAVATENLVSFRFPEAVFANDRCIEGAVISVDRFGNLITNIRQKDLMKLCIQNQPSELKVQIRGRTVEGLSDTYKSVPSGKPIAVIGSTDRLEISVNGGHAADVFNATSGEAVRAKV
jgi:S-adenosylmethionine hydrolase